MTFSKDLAFGKKYEQLATEYFNYTEIKYAPNRMFKPYDFQVLECDKWIKVEVKADKMTKKTGNICIEFKCSNKPSGITTTESNYYIYFVVGTDDVYKIPTNDIRKIIRNNNFITYKGGDNYRSEFYLIPKKYFVNYLVELVYEEE